MVWSPKDKANLLGAPSMPLRQARLTLTLQKAFRVPLGGAPCTMVMRALQADGKGGHRMVGEVRRTTQCETETFLVGCEPLIFDAACVSDRPCNVRREGG